MFLGRTETRFCAVCQLASQLNVVKKGRSIQAIRRLKRLQLPSILACPFNKKRKKLYRARINLKCQKRSITCFDNFFTLSGSQRIINVQEYRLPNLSEWGRNSIVYGITLLIENILYPPNKTSDILLWHFQARNYQT